MSQEEPQGSPPTLWCTWPDSKEDTWPWGLFFIIPVSAGHLLSDVLREWIQNMSFFGLWMTLSGEGPFVPYVASFVQPSVMHAMSWSLPHRISSATVMGRDCIPSLWFTAAFSTLGSCCPDQGRLIKMSTTHTLHISYTSLSRIPWILLS